MARIQLASLPESPVITRAGAVVPGASVYVYTHGGVVPVTVYNLESGGGTLAQPLTTDADGDIPGFVDESQRLDIIASGGGAISKTKEVNVLNASTEEVIQQLKVAADEVTNIGVLIDQTGYVQSVQSAAGNAGFKTRVDGDTFDRVQLSPDGYYIGPGSEAPLSIFDYYDAGSGDKAPRFINGMYFLFDDHRVLSDWVNGVFLGTRDQTMAGTLYLGHNWQADVEVVCGSSGNPWDWAEGDVTFVMDDGTKTMRFSFGAPGSRALSLSMSKNKLGFYGTAPITRPAHPANITDVITLLTNLGLCA